MFRSIQTSLSSLEGKLDDVTASMDSFAQRVDRQNQQFADAEQRIFTVEDQTAAHTSTLREMEKVLKVISAKNEDLEAGSRRNNIRIMGIPETTDTGRLEDYVETLLMDLFGSEAFSGMLMVERAHQTLAPRPPVGASPCPILARLLNYRDRDTVLRLARERK